LATRVPIVGLLGVTIKLVVASQSWIDSFLVWRARVTATHFLSSPPFIFSPSPSAFLVPSSLSSPADFWFSSITTMSVPAHGAKVGTNYRALPLGRSRPEYVLTSDPVRRRRIYDMSPKRYALYHYLHQELHHLDHAQLSTMLLKLAEKQTSEHLTQRIFKNVSMWSWRNVLARYPLGPVHTNWAQLPMLLQTQIESYLLLPFERLHFLHGFLHRTPSPAVLAAHLVRRAVLRHLRAVIWASTW
jgi:hypothetical protein